MLNVSSQSSFLYKQRLAPWWIYKITRAIYWPRTWTHQALLIIQLTAWLMWTSSHREMHCGAYCWLSNHLCSADLSLSTTAHPHWSILRRSLCCPASLCSKHILPETQGNSCVMKRTVEIWVLPALTAQNHCPSSFNSQDWPQSHESWEKACTAV